MPGPFRASTHDVRLALATAALLATLLLSASAASASPIKRDEEILFFPTAARLSADRSHWIVPLHAWVFEAETESLWRRGTLEGLGRSFGLDAGAAESAIFRQRARWFLVDNERGKRFGVTLAADGQDFGPSGADGHLRAEIALPRRAASEERTSFWLRYGAVLAPGDPRRFEGETLFASSEGLSVISDIDDTIKISRVTDRRALLAHTFLKPFEAAPGMAEAYARLAAAGADFHYVSSSPWQLFSSLPYGTSWRPPPFPAAHSTSASSGSRTRASSTSSSRRARPNLR